jgi:hypothetical protein
MKLPTHIKTLRSVIALTVLFSAVFVLLPSHVYAGATLNHLTDTLSNEVNNVNSTHTYTFQVTSTSAITSISITASSAWASTPPTTGWSVKDNASSETVGSPTTSTTVITIPVTSFTPSNGDTITIANATAWQNQASTGVYTETINTGNETGQLAIDLISSDTVTLSAVVGPTISFSISSTSLTLPPAGNLAISTTTNASNTTTLNLSTNASFGAVVTVSDLNQGLTSGGASHTIPSVTGTNPVALSNGVEAFGVGENAAPSTGSIYTRYSTGSVASVGQLFAAASAANFWTVPGPTNGATATPYFNTDIGGTTPAGNYSDTVTFLATGTF